MNEFKMMALYIDGDNASWKKFSDIYNNIQTFGKLLIRKVYFDFDNKSKWNEICMKHGIEPILVTNLSSKNSSDIRMITDMMETLYENPLVETFIILSADSDFSHVANKIRMKGKTVIGIGKSDVSKILVNNCDKYIDENSLCNLINEVKPKNTVVEKSFEEVVLSSESSESPESELSLRDLVSSLKRINPCLISREKLDEKTLGRISQYPYVFKVVGRNILIVDDIIRIVGNILSNHEERMNLGRFKEFIMMVDPSFDNRKWGYLSFRRFMETIFGSQIRIYQGRGRYDSTTFIEKKTNSF